MAKSHQSKPEVEEQYPSSPGIKTRSRHVAKMRKLNSRPATEYEIDDNLGRLESQQILAMSKQLAQQSDSKDDFMLKLNKRVKGDEKDLMDLLAGKKSEVAENDRSFISRLQNLPAATIGSVSPTSSTPSLQDPSYHSQSSQVITDSATLFQHCDDLLASYNSTAQAIATASPQTPTQTSDVEVQQGWQQDREKVERLLELGKRVTGRRVEGLVRGKTVEELVRDAERDVEEMEADALFTRAEAEEEVGEEGRGPGEVLRGIEKGAKRMVRGLSKERG